MDPAYKFLELTFMDPAYKFLELIQLLKFLRSAATPEELFEVVGKGEELRKNARLAYHRYSKIAHPDIYKEAIEKERAGEAQRILNEMWAKAEARMDKGTYGTSTPEVKAPAHVTFGTRKHHFTVLDRLHSGETAGLFSGVCVDKAAASSDVIIKVPHTHKDNDLIKAEAEACVAMRKKAKEIAVDDAGKKIAKLFLMRVPELVESFKLSEPGVKEQKLVNAFRYDAGYVSLEEIHKAYPGGVDPRAAVFMLNRIFEALTLAHAAGFTHHAVTPNHVLIHPSEHAGLLIDWTNASVGTLKAYIDKRYEDFYPPEMRDRFGRASSDVFMAAMCFLYVLGGDVKTFTVSPDLPNPLWKFLNLCLQPKPSRRPANAEIAYKEFKQAAEAAYGPRKWFDFAMPTSPK